MRMKQIYPSKFLYQLNKTFNTIVIPSDLMDVDAIPIDNMLRAIGYSVTVKPKPANQKGYKFEVDFDTKTIFVNSCSSTNNNNVDDRVESYPMRVKLANVFAFELYAKLNRIVDVSPNKLTNEQDELIHSLAEQILTPKPLVENVVGNVLNVLDPNLADFSTAKINTIAFRVADVLQVPKQFVLNRLDLCNYVSYLNSSILNVDEEGEH